MQLLLNIKDKNKATLLFEFLKSLNYVSSVKQIEDEQSIDVPEWQKDGVMKRLDDIKQNPNLIINRDELNNRIDSFKQK